MENEFDYTKEKAAAEQYLASTIAVEIEKQKEYDDKSLRWNKISRILFNIFFAITPVIILLSSFIKKIGCVSDEKFNSIYNIMLILITFFAVISLALKVYVLKKMRQGGGPLTIAERRLIKLSGCLTNLEKCGRKGEKNQFHVTKETFQEYCKLLIYNKTMYIEVEADMGYHFWFELTESAKQIHLMFGNLEDKIAPRLLKKSNDWTIIQEIIETLFCYEYLWLLEYERNQSQVQDQVNPLLLTYLQRLVSLGNGLTLMKDSQIATAENSEGIIKVGARKLIGCFASNFVITRFFAWLILCILILAILCIPLWAMDNSFLCSSNIFIAICSTLGFSVAGAAISITPK